jgi:phycobilisome core-membrane linker protein
MKPGLSSMEKTNVVKAAYRQVFERDITRAYSLNISDLESKVKNGQISMKEFIRRLGKSPLYRKNFYEPYINSRALELAFRHFLGRGPSSREEVQEYFAIVSEGGLPALVDALVDSREYADYFGEETVPYLRGLGQEAQECRNWGPQQDLFNYSAPFRKVPQFITTFADYEQPLPDQHPYGSGNDPLEIQFGAIFPKETRNPSTRPAPFGKDTRRILIRRGPGIYNQLSNPAARPLDPGSLGPKVFKLDQLPQGGSNANIQFAERSTQAVIRAAYLQVFGRDVYDGQRLKTDEIKLENGEITMREFIRRLAKSNLFRKMYWTSLYVTKAIEYIHRRLLGRPTYGRQETNQYFDICAKQGFYALVDALIDGQEYSESFGEDTVPYERYLTPGGVALRTVRVGSIQDKATKVEKEVAPRFVELGTPQQNNRTAPDVQFRTRQGVSKQREQTKVFKLTSTTDKKAVQTVIRAAYRQIFERDIAPYIVQNEFTSLESKLGNGEITVQEFITGLGASELYIKEFYTPYPNTKVIELGTKHFLGRAPRDQAEIRKYNQILASEGIRGFITAMVSSMEYAEVFGEDVVPYRRFPTLPAANFPNTERLYGQLTKQNKDLVVPSFEPTKPRMDNTKMPLLSKSMAEVEAASRQMDKSKPLFVELGRSFLPPGSGQSVEAGVGTSRRKPARIYRFTHDGSSAEVETIINAIYCQVMDIFSGQVPQDLRVSGLDSRLRNGEISVREFVRELASSDIYCRRFYTPYPNTKVIEFLFRHLLGRAPATQAEIRQYNKVLADDGLRAAVEMMVNSAEYARYFGEDVVPYKRFPSLPAGNYLGSVKADTDLVKQSWSDLSPSYITGRFTGSVE